MECGRPRQLAPAPTLLPLSFSELNPQERNGDGVLQRSAAAIWRLCFFGVLCLRSTAARWTSSTLPHARLRRMRHNAAASHVCGPDELDVP